MLQLFTLLLFPFTSYASNTTVLSQLLGNSNLLSSQVIELIGILTILSLAPAILIMVTSFTRIIIVFSFVRNAIGIQQSPPNQVLVSLAIFLTFFIMSPVFEKSYLEGIKPFLNNKINEDQAIKATIDPIKKFMHANTREKDLNLFLDIAKVEKVDNLDSLPLRALTPAFMISEIRRGFEIGFLLFLPFIIIDMLVASILMGMGMMMMPPVTVSLPFKVIFFVIIDGWYMLAGSLVKSFIT